jgi:hypothetical protein
MRIPLDPPPGLTDDDTTFATPGAWANGSNVRFVKGRPETIGPWAAAFGTALTGVCRNLKAWTDSDGNVTLAFGTHSALHVYWGSRLYGITPAGLAAGAIDTATSVPGYGNNAYGLGTYSMPASQAYARTWALDTWGENLIACPRGGTLYRWQNDPNVAAAAVANAPDEITAILTTPERQVLALGCNEEVSGIFNPLCVRGCDLENIGDWTTTSTNNAFEHILEGSGSIVTARMVGPYVAIWTTAGLYLGQFVGAPGQAYRFDLVAVNCGLIGPNAVQVVGQTAFWISPDRQIRTWMPGTQPQIISCPIWSDFARNLDTVQAAKVVAAELSQFGELWVHYPDLRDVAPPGSEAGENSRYVAVAINDGTWFRGALERTAFMDAGVAAFPIGADSGGHVWYHEHPAGNAVGWSLLTADTYIGEGEQGAEVQRFIADFERQDASVNLTLYVQKLPRSAAVTKGPYTIGTAAARKDLRAPGRIMAVELSGTGPMRLGKPEFEVVTRGLR